MDYVLIISVHTRVSVQKAIKEGDVILRYTNIMNYHQIWYFVNCCVNANVLYLLSQIDFCANNPCEDGYRCVDHGDEYSCVCPGSGDHNVPCDEVPRTVTFSIIFLFTNYRNFFENFVYPVILSKMGRRTLFHSKTSLPLQTPLI